MRYFLVSCFLIWMFLMGNSVANSQTVIPEPTHTYYNGIILSDDFNQSQFLAPIGVQLNLTRDEQHIQADGIFARHNTITWCNSTSHGTCYGDIHYTIGNGNELINSDYRRVEHYGKGPSIARKTAVRGAPEQWAVWAHQINLGPGAKAALWIGGDNPEIQGRGTDTTDHVIVIGGNLHVKYASIQRNAPQGDNAAVLRVYNGGTLVAEILENGTFRAKKFEIIGP